MQEFLLPQIDLVLILGVCEGVNVVKKNPNQPNYAFLVLQTVLHFYFSDN